MDQYEERQVRKKLKASSRTLKRIITDCLRHKTALNIGMDAKKKKKNPQKGNRPANGTSLLNKGALI